MNIDKKIVKLSIPHATHRIAKMLIAVVTENNTAQGAAGPSVIGTAELVPAL
jgi:hypothetical protein